MYDVLFFEGKGKKKKQFEGNNNKKHYFSNGLKIYDMEPNGTAELQTAIIRKILSLYDFNILKQLLTSLDNYTNEDGNFINELHELKRSY